MNFTYPDVLRYIAERLDVETEVKGRSWRNDFQNAGDQVHSINAKSVHAGLMQPNYIP